MKVIQSFWSGGLQKINEDSYGWLDSKYHWLSWILSAVQLNKFYEVELYTDQIGYEVLIEKLKLPYAKVHVVLDELNEYDTDLWALGKIKAYSLQDRPFLHVDGDVFIWSPFPDAFSKSELIAQNLEVATEYYDHMWAGISKELVRLPEEMQTYTKKQHRLACNMGIVGGGDIEFFKEYTAKSFEFVDNNREVWSKIDKGNFNIFFEQVLFHECAQKNSNQFSFLFSDIIEDNGYQGLADFNATPFEKTYLHLISFYKKDPSTCKQLENYVLRYYPEYYKNLEHISPEYLSSFDQFLPDYAFGLSQNEQLISSFNSQLNGTSEDIMNLLVQRDLFSLGQPQTYKELLATSQEFFLTQLQGWEIPSTSEGQESILIISEFDQTQTYHRLDELDEMILYLTENTILYADFLKQMTDALDEDALEMKDAFLQMVSNRIHYFLTHRVLGIVLQQPVNSTAHMAYSSTK